MITEVKRQGSRLCALLLIVVGASYPLFDGTSYGQNRLELVFVYFMAALSLNLAFGYGGQLAVGQPVMLTVAGYTSGILSVNLGWGFWQTAPLAVVASILTSVLLSLPSLRVRGWYLGVVGVLGVATVPYVVIALGDLTGGTDGLPGIKPIGVGDWLMPGWMIFEITLAITLLCWLALRNLSQSGWGTIVMSYRDHPVAAIASGVDTMRLRATIYVLCGVPCGIGGALYAHTQQFISGSNFTTQTVLLLLGAVFLGGPGTIWGPLIGVAIFEGLSLWLGPFSPWNPVFLGVGVLVAALAFRGGIVGAIRSARQRSAAVTEESIHLVDRDPLSVNLLEPLAEAPRLEVRNVAKRFGGNIVLRDVSFTAAGGSVTTVVGPNGSGKTTLLNCISGFVTPEAGSVVLRDADLTALPPHKRPGHGLARTFQVPRLVEGLSMVRNVGLGYLGLRPQRVWRSMFHGPGFRADRDRARARAADACLTLGFTRDELEGDVAALPLGLKRLVEIARALAADASVICLDEPVAGLNSVERDRVAAVLRALAAAGRSVLLIEHNLPFVLSVSDRIVLLQDGLLADEGEPADAADVSRPLGTYFQTFVARTEEPGYPSEPAHSDLDIANAPAARLEAEREQHTLG